MNVQGARARAAAARGFGTCAPVVVKRVFVDRMVRWSDHAAELRTLMEANARLARERDEWRSECARLASVLELRSAA